MEFRMVPYTPCRNSSRKNIETLSKTRYHGDITIAGGDMEDARGADNSIFNTIILHKLQDSGGGSDYTRHRLLHNRRTHTLSILEIQFHSGFRGVGTAMVGHRSEPDSDIRHYDADNDGSPRIQNET